MAKYPFTIRPKKFTGYVADPSNATADKLSYPSINCLINENGEVEQRLGFSAVTQIELGEPGKRARSWHVERYDVTVFVLGTKVKYFDWNTGSVYDTGLTLTDGTITRLDEFEGDVYMTNTTDGARRLIFGRLNDAAATLGDANVTVDTDMAVRMKNFGTTNRSLIIQGTAEAYTDETSITLATGVVALTGTLSQSYDNNAVCVVTQDLSGISGIQKASKFVIWKRRLGMFGSEVSGNSDQPNNTMYYGKFAAPTTLEDFISFDSGNFAAGGSTRELVGNYGRITNAVPVKDYLYQFTESEAYVTAAADVTTTGSGIGATVPDLRDPDNGCINEDCAASLGNDEISYLTPGKRIMRIRISAPNGAPVIFPDNNFDQAIRELLKNIDSEQPLPFVFHDKGARRTIHQVRILGQYYWLIYDHNIKDWQPPQQVICASSFFIRKGVLYATDADDDTVYSIGTSFSDNGTSFACEAWTGEFDIGDAMVKELSCTGVITQPAQVKIQAHVTNVAGGKRSGSQKTVLGNMYSYSEDHSVGAVPVGDGGVEAETQQTARWKANVSVFPSEGHTVQICVTQAIESGYFRWSTYKIEGVQSSSSQTPSK